MLRVLMDRVPKRSIVVRTSDKSWLDDREGGGCWLTVRSKDHIECVVVVERSTCICGCWKSIQWTEQITLEKCTKCKKRWSTGKTSVFCASSSLPPLVDRESRLVWSTDEGICEPEQRNLLPRMLETTGISLLRLSYHMHLRRSLLESWLLFWKSDSSFSVLVS